MTHSFSTTLAVAFTYPFTLLDLHSVPTEPLAALAPCLSPAFVSIQHDDERVDDPKLPRVIAAPGARNAFVCALGTRGSCGLLLRHDDCLAHGLVDLAIPCLFPTSASATQTFAQTSLGAILFQTR